MKKCIVCLVKPMLGCDYCDRVWCRECHASRKVKKNPEPEDTCPDKDHRHYYADFHYSTSLKTCYKYKKK